MICNFGNVLAKDLVEGTSSKAVRHFPNELVRQARKKLAMVHAAKDIRDLLVPPGNGLEKLTRDRKGFYSIRINDQWRVIFQFQDGNAFKVSVEDYHS